MIRSRKLERRRFLSIAGAAAAAGTAGCSGRSGPWRFLTAAEATALAALCEQVIPTDQDPGAAWAGAVEYIDRQLTGRSRKLQPVYRKGLAALHGFAEMPFDQQTAFLERAVDKEFFAIVIEHTMQAYYSDPRHGGNRDAVSWRMLGVPRIPIRGRRKA